MAFGTGALLGDSMPLSIRAYALANSVCPTEWLLASEIPSELVQGLSDLAMTRQVTRKTGKLVWSASCRLKRA